MSSNLLRQNPQESLVLIFLAQAGSEPKHQLHAFDFIQPIAEGGVQFTFVGRDDSSRAERTQSRMGKGAITVDGAITSGGAPLVIFGQEYDDGDPAAGVDAQFREQFAFLGALDKTQVDLRGVRFGNAINQRALLHAVAAPNAAEDQNFHFPHKAAYELLLDIGEMRGIVDLRPATLLLVCSGVEVAVVWKTRCKFVCEDGSVCHGLRIIQCACLIQAVEQASQAAEKLQTLSI